MVNYMKKIEEDRQVRQMLSPEEVQFKLCCSSICQTGLCNPVYIVLSWLKLSVHLGCSDYVTG